MLITLRMEGWWWSIRSIDSYAIRIFPLPVASILFPLLNSQKSQPRGHRLKFQNAFRTKPSIVTKHAARIISSFYDVITFFKSLRFKNFDIQRFSSSSFVYCSYFKLAMSNVVFVSKQFRTTNILSRSLPFFLLEKQSKSKLFNHLFLFYFLSISTFWKPIPSKGLWKIRKCIIYIKFSRSLPFTKWVIIFLQCRLN